MRSGGDLLDERMLRMSRQLTGKGLVWQEAALAEAIKTLGVSRVRTRKEAGPYCCTAAVGRQIVHAKEHILAPARTRKELRPIGDRSR